MKKMSSIPAIFYSIGILFIAILIYFFSIIIGYSPSPNFSYQEQVITPESSSFSIANCSGLESQEIQNCCFSWANENNLSIPMCVGEWAWSPSNGCQFSCQNNQ